MGILLAIAVFWSLAATLLVLPALLELQRRQAGQHWPTVVN
jgi:predicted RND superfamily exporter protein